jgi:putative acetyltransferase
LLEQHYAFLVNERPYEPGDLPRVAEIYTAAIHSLAAAYYSAEQLAAWAPIPADQARWQKRLADLHTIVVESHGLVAGFVSYTDVGYLDFLFTHPAFARRGVASRLYRRVESALLAGGVSVITTHASLAARRFFDRHGFQLICEELVECRGTYLRRFAMHKSITYDRGA